MPSLRCLAIVYTCLLDCCWCSVCSITARERQRERARQTDRQRESGQRSALCKKDQIASACISFFLSFVSVIVSTCLIKRCLQWWLHPVQSGVHGTKCIYLCMIVSVIIVSVTESLTVAFGNWFWELLMTLSCHT